jgi:hypothetical protein
MNGVRCNQLVDGCCEHDIENSDSIKEWKFLEEKSDSTRQLHVKLVMAAAMQPTHQSGATEHPSLMECDCTYERVAPDFSMGALLTRRHSVTSYKTCICQQNNGRTRWRWSCGLRRKSVAAWLLGSLRRIPPRVLMFVPRVCCVLCS